MTAREDQRGRDPGLSHHPAPQRDRVGGLSLAFATMGAPAAWFLQLTINYALFAQRCFAATERIPELPDGSAWRWPLALAVYIACLAVGVAATLVAVVLFRRTRGEHVEHSEDVEEAGSGRTRFFAYWGILLGVSFTTITAANLIALLALPPCAL